MPVSINNTTLTFNDGTTMTTAPTATGTVTSVATGNGLQGGTITTSGTLSVACPSYNSVGSYVMGGWYNDNGAIPTSPGSNYSAGGGTRQMKAATFRLDCGMQWRSTNNLSGTWKWMAATNDGTASIDTMTAVGLICRVS